ncbi:hypothetical protein [Phytohabitans rumicis]|uniref:Uncharacterized protein n=1 Tax=Phytohabitans rumicis TaxID=1076125 RepID=A0A6V8LFG6_9ACTN|nr:hypothetical protein [Phytohabitans rumicis]GFJ93359.1 hypothetical protein Prum_070010 [Phytohabitans rumicis]
MTGPPNVPDAPTDPELLAELAAAVGRPTDGLVAADAFTISDSDGPVTIIVWRFATGHEAGSDPAARLARLLVRTYTTPGAVVVDLNDDPTLRSATQAMGRSYVPVTSPTRLTGPAHVRRPAGLVALRWPHQQDELSRNLVDVLTTCRGLLAPDGCLLVSRATTTPDRRYTDDARTLLAAARRAQLRRLHHIVAVTVPLATDQFTYHTTPDEVAALHHDAAQTGGHYQDLLVFVVPVGTDA